MSEKSGSMSEDLELRIVSGPPRYTSRTGNPVEHVKLVDANGALAGYFYANDEDSAAGWVPAASATPDQQNLAASWSRILHSGKARGLKPSEALDELLAASNPRSKLVANSRKKAASLTILRELAAKPRPDVP